MRGFLAGMLLSFAVLAAHPAVGQSAPQKALKTAEKAELGTYLTDGSGLSLYMFEEDRRGGDRGRPVESDCLDQCLENWPPVVVDAAPKLEGKVDPALVSSFKRLDGKVQATYNGWPIYYFHMDFAPGDTNGHDLEEFGGEWYLLAPSGSPVGQKAEGAEREDGKRRRRGRDSDPG